jgi:hypothetical protein
MFKKKFKVRVNYFGDDYYCIEYSYGYFTIWLEIEQFIWVDNASRTINGWNPVLKSHESAIHFAKQFKTIEDVNNWYAKQREIESNFERAYKEHKRKTRPFKTKQII